MFSGHGREDFRRAFHEAWQAYSQGLPQTPLAIMIAEIVHDHPEYHALLSAPYDEGGPDGSGQDNPYLHLALHIALQEQISTGRPATIGTIHERLCRRLGDRHAAEHRIMECLGEILWEAQRQGKAPDETAYLALLEQALVSG